MEEGSIVSASIYAEGVMRAVDTISCLFSEGSISSIDFTGDRCDSRTRVTRYTIRPTTEIKSGNKIVSQREGPVVSSDKGDKAHKTKAAQVLSANEPIKS